MKPKLVAFIPAIVWFLLIAVLLVLPPADLPDEGFLSVIYFDKWVHAGLFGGMVFFAIMPHILIQQFSKKLLIKITIASAIYGVAMEYVQKYLTTSRDFDYMDMLADAAGCIIAYFLMQYIASKYSRKENLA